MARRTASIQRNSTPRNVVPISRDARKAAADRRSTPHSSPTTAVENAQAIACLMQGMTMQATADQLGIHRRTLERRLAKPEAQALIAQAERDLLATARRTLLHHARSGVATLALAAAGRITHPDGTVEHVPWATRVTAAGKLVDAAVGRRVELAEAMVGEDTGARDRLSDRIAQMRERLDTPDAEAPKAKRAPRRKASGQ